MPEPPADAPKVEEKPATKMADHPHWWTIALHAFAISVSIGSAIVAVLSWTETRENRRINEATSRAFVRVASAMIDTRSLYPHDNPKFRRAIVYLVVTNTGKVAAKNLRVEYELLEQNKEAPNGRVDGAMGRPAHFREMVPGASETIRFGIPVLVRNKRLDVTDRQFSLDVRLIYNDGLNSGDKVEGTIMCGGKPDKAEGGLATLYYCVSFVGEYDQDGKPLKR
ncbi:MAG: hypothetical protein WD696_05910 [Bryobacteraceae bacterium]